MMIIEGLVDSSQDLKSKPTTWVNFRVSSRIT